MSTMAVLLNCLMSSQESEETLSVEVMSHTSFLHENEALYIYLILFVGICRVKLNSNI